MRWILFSLSVAALLLNVGFVALLEPDTDDGVTGAEEGPDGASNIISDLDSVTVPELRIGDQALYDYELYAVMYSENYSSGEWEKYTFTGEGEFLQYVAQLQDAEDGFGRNRKTVRYGYETKASFRVKIQSSDGEDVTIPGTLDVERSEFRNVFDEHLLKSMNTGSISIENLGTLINENIPSGSGVNLDYNADLKSYPIPSRAPVETLDQSIYGEGRRLRPTSRGSYEGDPFYEEDNRVYNWSVEGAFEVQGHDTYRINVTSNLWDWIFFNRTFFVSSDSPYPIKGNTRTNTSAYWDDGEFYITMETSRELKDYEGALRRGENPIPWGDDSGHEEYDLVHPAGEYDHWEYGPADGSDVDRSSFNGWTQENAIRYARENSPGLRDFLAEHEAKGKVLLDDSVFNISTEDRLGNNETKWWNLTFSYAYDMEEMKDYYESNEEWPEWRYRILVARSVKENRQGTTVSTFVSRDEGDDRHGQMKVRWDNGVVKDDLSLNSRIITMTHAERILKLDPEVKSKAFNDGRISEDVLFYYGIIGITEDTNPGFTLIEQLTGISTPTADNAVGFRQDSVRDSGSMFSSAVEANTGQMLYVTNVEGTALSRVFGV